jgi:hypothetical protein
MIKNVLLILTGFVTLIYYGKVIVKKQYGIMEVGRELAQLDQKKLDLEAEIKILKLQKEKILQPAYLEDIAKLKQTHVPRADQFLVLSKALEKQMFSKKKKKKKNGK